MTRDGSKSTWELLTNPDDDRHGTDNGYTNHFCRCDRCTAANAVTVAEARARRASKPIPDHVHGTANGYINYRCRCQDCRDAYATSVRERRQARKRTKA